MEVLIQKIVDYLGYNGNLVVMLIYYYHASTLTLLQLSTFHDKRH
jgi:hypothetical protein